MNILLIAYYYPPINSGGTMRPLKMAKYLAQMGHEVSVLTHTYGTDHIEQGNPTIIRFTDISYNRDRVGMRRFVWMILRAWTELLNQLGQYHSIYSWWKKKILKNSHTIIHLTKPEVIIATYPPVETLEIGLFLAKQYQIRLITDFRDGLIFEPIESKRMKAFKCIRNHYQRIERETVQASTAVTTIAPPIADYYRATYAPTPVEVISNAFDTEDLEDLPTVLPFEANCFHIVFTGRFGLSDIGTRVDYFFNAIRQILKQQPTVAAKIRIHLFGEYSEEELNDINDVIEAGLVIHHGFVERRHSLAFQRQADLLLIITSPERKSLVTAKIFEYLFAGKPILALTHQTVLAEMMLETKAGWVVHPWHTQEIVDVILRILREPGFYQSIQPDNQAIENYSIYKQMEKLGLLLEKI